MSLETSFTRFKESFYGRAKDLSLFDFRDVNLLKVILDGLKVRYNAKGKVRVVIFRSPRFINLFFFLKRSGNNSKPSLEKNAGKKKYLIVDAGGRTAWHGNEHVSFYFKNILDHLGRENVCYVTESNKQSRPANDLNITVYDLALAATFGALNRSEIEFLKDLKASRDRIIHAGLFSAEEIADIEVALQQFFISWRVWSRLLEQISPEKIFLLPHYHREGAILAMKQKGIKVTEVQHGLIAATDIFYVLPQNVRSVERKALFADELFVYGNYWKKVVTSGAGYEEGQVKIAGYYPFRSAAGEEIKHQMRSRFGERKIVLLTTQTFMHEHFIRIAEKIVNEMDESTWQLVVKLHPAEPEEKYERLKNAKSTTVTKENLDHLLSAASIHVSVFSTTLFDALRFGIPNFAIRVAEYDDYVQEIEKSGVAKVLNIEQCSGIFSEHSQINIDPQEFFAREDLALFE